MHGVLRCCSRSKYVTTSQRFLSLLTNGLPRLSSTPSLQKCMQKRNILFKMGNETPPRVVGYYVVFPHIPEETVENNRFMYNIAKGEDWPTLATATPKEMYEGTVRMLMEYGATCMEHLELLNKCRTFKSYGCFVSNFFFNIASQNLRIKIMSARDHMEICPTSTSRTHPMQLYDAKEGLTEWQLRLLEWYLLEFRASGLDRRDDKSRKLIGSWNRFIDEYRSKYISNIMSTNDQHVFTITDKAMLKDAPPHVLQVLAADPAQWEQGPWRGRMTPYSIYPFLEYCSNRQLRAEAWEKWISKASFDHDFYNNSVNIEELRHNKLTRRIRPVFIDRMESWTAFAQAKELMSSNLQAHDLAYICRKEAEQHYE
ncbi:hypothetical protein COOONC_03444 [Cooperia oncophora]